MASSKASRLGEEYVNKPSAPALPRSSSDRLRFDLLANHTTSSSGFGSRIARIPDCKQTPANLPRTRMDKVNAELVVLTYGTIVAQLCKDFDSDYVEVNKQLDKMGYNIGLRLIEDYLAKSNTVRRCSNFRETADMIAKVGGLGWA